MARTRSIKPSFFDNDILGNLPPLTRLLFIGLWTLADREGRLEDNPRKIKKVILGYDDVSVGEVNDMLQILDDNEFILRYKTSGGDYIQITNFVKHQNPHVKEKPSEIPSPLEIDVISTPENPDKWPENEDAEESVGQAPDKHQTDPGKHQTSTVLAQPITDYRLPITDYLSPSTGDPPDEDGDNPPDPGNKKAPAELRFELFWKAYPRKEGKKAAKAAFEKVNPDTELFSRIMEAIGRARTTEQWKRENGRFIPHPTTWLNQGRWDDEIEEVSTHEEFSGNSIPTNGKQLQPRTPPVGGKFGTLSGFKPAEAED